MSFKVRMKVKYRCYNKVYTGKIKDKIKIENHKDDYIYLIEFLEPVAMGNKYYKTMWLSYWEIFR